jgi:hypothetical protein
MTGVVAVAQDAAKPALPDTTTCPESIASIATCYGAKHETGAYLLAAMPRNWNGHLIVFAHGGPDQVPPTAKRNKASLDRYSIVVRRGFAWVASSYRREGYGVAMAAADSDDARKFFIDRIGKPARTILHGTSYGGQVGAKLIETYAKNADGSTNFDGAFLQRCDVAGPSLYYQHNVDLRVVYQYYCKNLPRPDEPQYPLWMGLPAGSKMTVKDLESIVDECTGITKRDDERTTLQKQNLANILGVMNYPGFLLVREMQNATMEVRDIVQGTTGGRNPFSNVGISYKGSADDAALNRDVARFAADPAAVAALRADGDPTGVLPVPVVSIHSISDTASQIEEQSAYRDIVTAAGSGDRLVQAFTDEHAHLSQSAPELVAALDALMQWIEKGVKPTPQTIAVGCEQLRGSLDGPCLPKPFASLFYPREVR